MNEPFLCPECGAPARVLRVDEHTAEGVRVTYVCPNRRCAAYGSAIGTRLLPDR